MDDYDDLEEAVSHVSMEKASAENTRRPHQWTNELESCPYCNSLVDTAICGQASSIEHSSQRGWQWPEPTLEDVRKSAADGCQSCDLLHKIIQDFEMFPHAQQKSGSSQQAASNAVVLVDLKKTASDRPDRLSLQLKYDGRQKSRRSDPVEVRYLSQSESVELSQRVPRY